MKLFFAAIGIAVACTALALILAIILVIAAPILGVLAFFLSFAVPELAKEIIEDVRPAKKKDGTS